MTRGSPPQTCAAAITQTDVFLSLQEAAAAATGGQHRSDLTWCNTSTFLPHFFLGPKLEIFRRRGGLIFSASGPDNDVPFIRLAPLAGFVFSLEKKRCRFLGRFCVLLFPSNGATCDGAHFRWLRFSPCAADRSLSAEEKRPSTCLFPKKGHRFNGR